jgi:tetratricopeptide (TPR) repeat protein
MSRVFALWLFTVLALVAGAVGAYFLWPKSKPAVPVIQTGGLDKEVVEAIEKARTAVEADPKSAGAWGNFGLVLFAQNRYADSIPIFAEAERLDPADARWPYYLGLALVHQKPDEGIAALKRAAEVPPGNVHMRLRLAEEYMKLGRDSDADPIFRQILAEVPNPRAQLGRGQVLVRRRQFQEALVPLKAAAESPLAKHSARVALVEAYTRLNQPGEAETQRKLAAEAQADVAWPDPFLAQAFKLQTGLQARIDQARQLLLTGQPADRDRAGHIVLDVLKDHPDSDEAHLTMAKILIAGEHFDEAETELQKATKLNPSLVDGYFLLAGVQVKQRDFEGAERNYLHAIELRPNYGLAYFNLGDLRIKMQNRTKAIDAFREAVRYRPDLAATHLELGAALLQDSKPAEALPHLENAVRLDGKNERAQQLLAQAKAAKR